MPSLNIMGKLLLHLAIIGAIVVAIDGWRTDSHQADARRKATHPDQPKNRSEWLSELLPEDVLQEFQGLLDSMDSTDPTHATPSATGKQSDLIAPFPLAGVSADTNKLESLYKSARTAMNSVVAKQATSAEPSLAGQWSIPFFPSFEESKR